MIAQPSIGQLLNRMHSRYILVTAVSKRARQLANEAEPLTNFDAESKVSIAAHEVAEGKVYIVE